MSKEYEKQLFDVVLIVELQEENGIQLIYSTTKQNLTNYN